MHDDQLPFERPLGARPAGDGLTEFRVWAPHAREVAVRVRGADHPLPDEGLGSTPARCPPRTATTTCSSPTAPRGRTRARAGSPTGCAAPAASSTPRAFTWTDEGFTPPAAADAVVYELHVGTFTQAGTFDAAIEHLPALADLGFTAIEVMPVAEFPGERGWGYDGAFLWRAQSSYGGPEGFARFVDAAHAAGLAVILDLVPNHVGASGAQALEAFGAYFTDRYGTFWGARSTTTTR